VRRWQAVIKRLLDLGLGLLALLVVLPAGLMISLAVVVDSSGPAIYGARRVGRGGREFTMYKFRSMARGAEHVGPGVTGAYDYRVTRVGAFLRRTKLDELPQLINVLLGQMSLVGPRPEAPRYVEQWTEEERAVLSVRPGITGPTQVVYIDEEELLAAADPDEVYATDLLHAKLAVDLAYVRHFSIRQDISILWRTVVGIVDSGPRRTERVRRRYTLSERLRSARLAPLVLDGFLAAVAASIAVGLRIDRNNIFAAVATYWVFVPLAAVIRPAGFVLAGAYLRIWRYPTISDVVLVAMSLVGGSLVMTVAIFAVLQPWAFPGTVGFPRSAILIELVISMLVLGGIRIASRVRQTDLDSAPASIAGPPKPVLIYGAGDAGALLAREMIRNRALHLDPVGFVDDDESKRGQRLYGIEVLGHGGDLPSIVAERQVAEVIVALPRATGSEIRRILTLCEMAAVDARTLPGVQELLDESVAVSKVRPLRIDDLVSAQTTDLSMEPVRDLLTTRTLLITGGGGSIGVAVARQALGFGVGKVVLLDRSDTALALAKDELQRRYPKSSVGVIVADVASESAVGGAFRQERPEVVVHAAAQKHVALGEANPSPFIQTNLRGTRAVVEAAAGCGVAALVLVSSDKAADPTSVVGATCNLAEQMVREIAAEGGRHFVSVRFPHVLGTTGGVVDVFRRQIEAGGPVTVTDPLMVRTFITLTDAARLVLLAAAVGVPGEIHAVTCGRPLRIIDLAHDMIRLSIGGATGDIQIEEVGLRPGEVLDETLSGPLEWLEPTNVAGLSRVVSNRDAEGSTELVRKLELLAETEPPTAVRAELLGV
jgi:FlaA1/EpsC-like NDP-sugar epimerase/lipopolysaccharide/colanic/teichoic acid biosynthesis glycosyltransferase